MEQDDIKIIQHPDLIHELTIFRCERTVSGKTRYEAPEGQNDDCVCAIALAIWDLQPKQERVYDDVRVDGEGIEVEFDPHSYF